MKRALCSLFAMIAMAFLSCSAIVSSLPVQLERVSNPQDYAVNIRVITTGTFMGAVGGGTAIQTDSNGTYILTVAHVCDNPVPPFPYDITVFNMQGRGTPATIVATDSAHDLCLLHTDARWSGVLSTIVDPRTVDLFAPLENYGNAVGIFQGYDLPSRELNDHHVLLRNTGEFAGIFNDWIFVHSIPTVGGQSGSAVIYDGMLIGVISMGITTGTFDAEHVSLSVRGDVVYEFLMDNRIELHYTQLR